MLSRFETTDDAQGNKSIDEAKEGECYEWVGSGGIHKFNRLTRLSIKTTINNYTIQYKLNNVDPDSNEDVELNKLIEELDKPKSEESNNSKKDKNPFKDKKNDESNTYEFSDDIDLSDNDW